MKCVDKVWGVEEILVNNELYCFKRLHVRQGYRCSYHAHPKKDETFILESGIVFLQVHGDDPQIMDDKPVRILPGVYHSFGGIVDSIILEISTNHSDDDCIRASGSGCFVISELIDNLGRKP